MDCGYQDICVCMKCMYNTEEDLCGCYECEEDGIAPFLDKENSCLAFKEEYEKD